ncbi:transglutaminase family protein [Pseudaestuariivita atlantica]|uniref:Transglutaminase n=1 Tax=Pseudaestuariivita atlantica TaxID=1317121 RepID=A0A0L1JN38_9RHOB|nr:transglutaminase family protein [Pseudaestuariivita atlantica]KNG93122.1 transglutaminase [Pseudaestuariivita atlantica]
MLLKITHQTTYRFDTPMAYGLQQVRKTPKSHGTQEVLSWDVAFDGAREELSYRDAHMNTVQLISFAENTTEVTITCSGEVSTEDTSGVVGRHAGFLPMWLFERTTPLTQPGPGVRALVKSLDEDQSDLDRMHALSRAVADAVSYRTGSTEVSMSAEDVLEAGNGVCQDHAHVFIAAARAMGVPARYVSGYLMLDDRIDQDASHAWAEAWTEGLGWVGFDVSNGICPDARYVKVATGFDYTDAAPVSGLRFGAGAETLDVALRVEQQ